MPAKPDLQFAKKQARAMTREELSRSRQFYSIPFDEQLKVYSSAYKENLSKLLGKPNDDVALAVPMAQKGPQTAQEMIDVSKHGNVRMEQVGDIAGEFIESVDFPGFVRDLLKAVFDANLEVTLAQMENYKDLLKTAAASVAKFVKEIDNSAAFGYLAENNSDEFSLDFDDLERDENNEATPVLLDKEGNEIARGNADIGDNEVKAKIMDAKIAMAKEHRALIREMILMGVTRLVTEKGTVKASVLFDMKATEQIKKADKAMMRESQSVTKHFGGGFLGFIGGGRTRTQTKSQISVSSVKSQADTSLAARMAGSVEIVFKSDYFKLDNFAAMYAPQVTEKERQAVSGTV